jgi:arabinogalactan oligomer/maltooligosaccharide transport system permease protein
VLWTVTNVALHVALGVTLALALREPWIRLRGVWRALLVVPWAIPNYITALVWKGMFHAQYGAVNTLLSAFSGQDVRYDWFSSFLSAFTANLVTNTWLGFPFMMVTTLGVLTSIPRDLEEAARIDGATWWQRFRHVVWPQLAPGLLPAVVLGSVWTFNLFNVVFLVSQGEPNSTTEILVSEAYRWAFTRGNRYGYAAAYSVLVFAVLLGFSRVTNRLLARAEVPRVTAPSPLVRGLVHAALFLFTVATLYPVAWVLSMAVAPVPDVRIGG